MKINAVSVSRNQLGKIAKNGCSEDLLGKSSISFQGNFIKDVLKDAGEEFEKGTTVKLSENEFQDVSPENVENVKDAAKLVGVSMLLGFTGLLEGTNAIAHSLDKNISKFWFY